MVATSSAPPRGAGRGEKRVRRVCRVVHTLKSSSVFGYTSSDFTTLAMCDEAASGSGSAAEPDLRLRSASVRVVPVAAMPCMALDLSAATETMLPRRKQKSVKKYAEQVLGHWAWDWRALALTRAQCRAKKNFSAEHC